MGGSRNEFDQIYASINMLEKNQKTAFGQLEVEMDDAVVQMKAGYGLHPKARTLTIGAATAETIDNLYTLSTGASTNTTGALFSIRQVHFRAGQGAKLIGDAIFDTPEVGSTQVFGLATAADALVFGYNLDADFCIQRDHDGHVIVQQLTITTPASGGENATITIDGTGFTVPLTAGTEIHNANEIADSLNAQVPTWVFSQNSDFVMGRSLLAAPAVGAFTMTSATAVGAFTEIATGITTIPDNILQADWNVDVMDGTGPSGMTLDPQKGNVYEVQFQYGFGAINFFIENFNTGERQLVHQIKYANNFTTPSISNPSFRIAWVVTNTTNNTNVVLRGSTAAGFNQGQIVVTDDGHAEDNTKSVGTAVFESVLTLRNRIVFGTNANLAEVSGIFLSAFADTSKGAIVEVIKGTVQNPVILGGTPNFQYKSELSSVMEVDTGGTTVTGGELVHSLIAGQDASVDLSQFNGVLQSGETITLAARIISGASSEVTVSVSWNEDI